MIKKYADFIKESHSKTIKLTPEEVSLFSSEPVLQSLISDEKVSLSKDSIQYDESDIKTKEILDQYLEIASKVEEKVGDFKSFNETLDGHMGAEEDENKDSITVPGFTKEELDEIKKTAMRLLSPGFHEDYEVGAYLSSVANDDPKIEKLLVKWLKSQGANFYQPEYRDKDDEFDDEENLKPIGVDNLSSEGTNGLVCIFSPLESDMVEDWNDDEKVKKFIEEKRLFLNELSYDEWSIYGIEGDNEVKNYIIKNYSF